MAVEPDENITVHELDARIERLTVAYRYVLGLLAEVAKNADALCCLETAHVGEIEAALDEAILVDPEGTPHV